jgi:hypothetical protein
MAGRNARTTFFGTKLLKRGVRKQVEPVKFDTRPVGRSIRETEEAKGQEGAGSLAQPRDAPEVVLGSCWVLGPWRRVREALVERTSRSHAETST